jgi:hypothetical protein
MRRFLLGGLVLSAVFLSAGCGEITYPKENLLESVTKLCEQEYAVDIDAGVAGNTLAIYLPLMDLFDITLNLSEAAQDKVQNILLGASRVALSTDADIKFYCIIAQDVRLPEIQLVIIKYVDDIKRAFYHDISRGEYFKRTIIDMNENPQAKKEQVIMDVFKKMELDRELQDTILDDFFRSEPSSLEGIGYWNGKFYIKDITLEEFLAEQMTNRIKMRFREKKPLNKYALKMITGRFASKNEVRFFLINFNAEPLLFLLEPDEKIPVKSEIFTNVFEEASDVLYGYKFDDFDWLEVVEENTSARLTISKDDIYLFKRGKLGIGTILGSMN